MKKLLLFIIFIVSTGNLILGQPGIPKGLKASVEHWKNFKYINLQWNVVSGRNIKYFIYRKDDILTNSGRFYKLPLPVRQNSFNDKLVIPGKTYSYYVTAVNSAGESSPSNKVDVTIADSSLNAYIYGNITDENTGNPIPDALVNFIPVWGWRFNTTKTDSQGNYLMKLSQGEYFISTNARGYQSEFYDNVRSIFDAEKIELGAHDSVDINVKLNPVVGPTLYTISGKIVDSAGTPIKARVEAVVLNRGIFDHFRGTITDSSGTYTLKFREGDSIAILAYPYNRNYIPEFYNNKNDFTEADKFVVTGNLSDIDFVLAGIPKYNNSVNGIVANENGTGILSNVTIFKLNENNRKRFTRTTMTDTLGHFAFSNLIPGKYIVLALPIDGYVPTFYKYNGSQTLNWRDADSIEVNENTEINGINFSLLQFPDSGYGRVAGLIQDKNGNALNGVVVYAIDDNSNIADFTTSDFNGRYSLNNLAPGKYTIATSKIDFESAAKSNIILDYNSNMQQQVNINMSPVNVTEIKEKPNTQIKNFELYQNYPNPFNPVTTIGYQIPSNTMVTLKVYNIIGQEISTLVSEYQSAGTYKVEFDASELNSGIYFYKLNAGNITLMRKMVVIK